MSQNHPIRNLEAPSDNASTQSSLDDHTTEKASQENELSQVSTELEYPPRNKALPIVACLFLTTFLVSLDRLIIGVAIPKITDDFHSLGDVGWYGSAYLLTSSAFMLLMGKVYTLFHPKWVFLSSLVVFEIGSAICGAAPNSKALIVGRAIAGLGSSGLFQGAVVMIVYVIPLHKRPQVMGIGGLVFGVSSAIGPLLGGALTDGPGWRWCFYINLPCGALIFTLLCFLLHIPEGMLPQKASTVKDLVTRLDLIGTFFFLPSVICLLLALQWGGVTYNWSNARIIVLFILSGVLFVAFLFIQRWKGDNATVPGHIFFNRSILAGASFSFLIGSGVQTIFYFLPIWFQAIKGVSAVKSGIMNLPMILGLVIASLMAGILTRKTGYFAPWMILSSVFTPIGAGLITTFTPSTAHPAWIGYQALYGIGLGLGNQQPSVAAQTILARKDVAIGAALMMFNQNLGGAIFLSIGNNLFDNRLTQDLARIPGINVGSVVSTGATDLRTMVPSNLLPQVLGAYNDALRNTFYLATGAACCMVFGAAAMEWKSVKKNKPAQASQAEKGEAKPEEKA